MVTFTPTIGSVTPPDAPTVNGIATATFLAGASSGTGVIHAFSGPARTGSGNSSSGGVEVKIGAAAAGSIAVQRDAAERFAERRHGHDLGARPRSGAAIRCPACPSSFSASTSARSARRPRCRTRTVSRARLLTTTQTAKVTATAGRRGEGRDASRVGGADDHDHRAGYGQCRRAGVDDGRRYGRRRQLRRARCNSLDVDFGDGTQRDARRTSRVRLAFTHTYQAGTRLHDHGDGDGCQRQHRRLRRRAIVISRSATDGHADGGRLIGRWTVRTLRALLASRSPQHQRGRSTADRLGGRQAAATAR